MSRVNEPSVLLVGSGRTTRATAGATMKPGPLQYPSARPHATSPLCPSGHAMAQAGGDPRAESPPVLDQAK